MLGWEQWWRCTVYSFQPPLLACCLLPSPMFPTNWKWGLEGETYVLLLSLAKPGSLFINVGHKWFKKGSGTLSQDCISWGQEWHCAGYSFQHLLLTSRGKLQGTGREHVLEGGTYVPHRWKVGRTAVTHPSVSSPIPSSTSSHLTQVLQSVLSQHLDATGDWIQVN